MFRFKKLSLNSSFLLPFINIKSFSRYRFEEDDDDEEDEGDINTKGDLYVELSKKEKVDFEELPDFEATSDPKYIKKMDNIGRRRKQSLNKDDAYYEETI